jgi:hypothetical protein
MSKAISCEHCTGETANQCEVNFLLAKLAIIDGVDATIGQRWKRVRIVEGGAPQFIPGSPEEAFMANSILHEEVVKALQDKQEELGCTLGSNETELKLIGLL